MKKKKSYPLLYKLAYAIGKEKELVPRSEQLKIPKQTKYYWRSLPETSIVKLEDQLQISKEVKQVITDNNISSIHYRKLLMITARIHFKSVDFIGEKNYIKILERNKREFVNLIEAYSNILTRDTLLKWFKVQPRKYLVWYYQIQYECDSSKILLCAKKFPQQLTIREFTIIEKALFDPNFRNWPKCAIHADLVKRKLLTISRSTFYKHASKILPSSNRKQGKRKKHKPLRAMRINEYWHFDISYFRTLNGEKQYIYAIIDNFSRKILAWRCEDKIRNSIVCEMLEEALGIKIKASLTLVSDGGSENIGNNIRKIVEYYKLFYNSEISHKIALKDIRYSNSMIERFFRIMKSDYLYIQHAENPGILIKQLKSLIIEYNFIRPHYSLGYLTPDEKFRGLPQPDLSERIKKAREKRYLKNKTCNCMKCTCS
ncbi:MAG: transposase [Bacteroidetes bacterium]|jgi:putative transposase|nr:transposase [Bacteroidota bacterium]MBT5530246.1 transposase [Cytophagia bacterium]MBT3935746.1 transposase [Bacteroidota bacterium]MBT4339144.1 transposase [Bacteroidota bacterium]MBT4729646.1 transposase [Bacteroidota bacterium]